MRKILLGTTAVVGLALVAQAANAQTSYTGSVGLTGAGNATAAGSPNVPTTPSAGGLIVRLGGFFDFSAGNVSDSADKSYYRAGNGAATFNANTGVMTNGSGANVEARQRNDFRTEAELNVYIDGLAANGMRYGAVFELQMDGLITTSGSGTGVDFDELYGFVKGSWGELRFGQLDAAAGLMQVRRPSVLWMGSTDGWDEFVGPAIGGSQPYLMSGVGDGGDATKIVYLSPQMSGFDFGVSYAANRFEGESNLNPSNTAAYQRDPTAITNELTGALRYRGTIGPIGVAAGVVGMWGDAASQSASGTALPRTAQGLTTYSAGLVLSGHGLQVGGEYTWGNYRQHAGIGTIERGVDGSKHWLLGAVYTTGPLAVGVQYGLATQDNGTASGQNGQTQGAALEDRKQSYLGVGASYIIAPGMTFFANYNQIKDENIPLNGVMTNANGNTAIAGGGAGAGTTLAQFDANGSKVRDISVIMAGIRVAF